MNALSGRFDRPAGFETWNRYAAVNDEFVAIHMDDAAGRVAGMPGAFGMGNLTFAYLHCAIREMMPRGAVIEAVSVRFRHPMLAGTVTVWTSGVVVTKEEPPSSVALSLTVTDGQGSTIATGDAVLILPTDG